MPEGPSIVIMKEAVEKFAGREVIAVEGNSKIDFDRMLHKKVLAFKSWGKHFLICFEGFTIRVHLLMFGTYLIDERKDRQLRLSLRFDNGELNIYSAAVRLLEGDADAHYDWSGDVMNDGWDAGKAKAKMKEKPEILACDALLEQDIFSGVGNIIKNEVLYRIYVHPKSQVGKMPPEKIDEMIAEARNYSFDFLEWKKAFVLKKHWLAHGKRKCKRCELPMIKEVTGVKKRNSFYCVNCQALY